MRQSAHRLCPDGRPSGRRPGYRGKAREVLAEAIAMYRQIAMLKHVEVAKVPLSEVDQLARRRASTATTSART